jgi:hypothetical protein
MSADGILSIFMDVDKFEGTLAMNTKHVCLPTNIHERNGSYSREYANEITWFNDGARTYSDIYKNGHIDTI